VAITSNKIIHFLYYCYHLHGGNINCLSSIKARLVLAGFAIVWDYVLSVKGKSVGVIGKPLVQNFLDGMACKPEAYAQCNRYIANEIQQAPGTSTARLPS